MLNRVRSSLIEPGQLIAYRKDSLIKVWAYLLFFAVLMSTSTLISVLNFTGIDQRLQNQIKDNTIPLNENCAMVEASLVCETPIEHTFITLDNFRVIINAQETLTLDQYAGFRYYFVFHQETVYLVFMGNIVESKPIASLYEGFHNIDLNFTNEQRNSFYDTLFAMINQEVLALRTVWGPLVMLTSILSALLLFNVFVIINSLISRARVKEVSFRHMYVMMSYAATALYIVLIFESMLQFNLFIFIVLLFVAFRQMTKLTLEIYARLNKN